MNNNTENSFELKGAAFTIPVLYLLNSNLKILAAQLAKKVGQAAAFFLNAPIVIDLQRLDDAAQVDLSELIHLLKKQGFIPVGLSGGSEQQKNMANDMKLAILSSAGSRTEQQPAPAREPEDPPEEKTDAPAADPPPPALLVSSPVRSGQRIAAPGDLIVAAQVSSGAEILAVGNIHVYGSLRGRALAGNQGDENARIFCQSLEADLLSIAGQYMVNEDFPAELCASPVQIHLQEKQLLISALPG